MTTYLRKDVFYLVTLLFYLSIHNVVFAVVPELLTKLEKTAFETSNEYQSRVKPLIETFNKAVEERQPEYVAGHVTLDAQQYDINTSAFLLKIQWTDWALPIAVLEDGMIKLQRDKAKTLFESSTKQALPVFISLAIRKSEIVLEKVILFGNGESREILIGGGMGAPEDLLNPKKDVFETESQFQARRERLLAYYNTAVQQRNPEFQAGIGILHKQGYDGKELYFQVSWREWVNQQFNPSGTYFMSILGHNAIKLLRNKQDKAIFISLELKDNKLLQKPFLTSGKTVHHISELLAGKSFRDCPECPEMVWIPAGSFLMSASSLHEFTKYNVTIPQPFPIGKYEVTFGEYDIFAKETGRELPSDEGWGRDKRPVINVTMSDAIAYTKWLSQKTGRLYRLPFESEWEYAGRAGTDTRNWWGDEIGSNNANCRNSTSGDSYEYTSPVGSFKPNPFGIYDTTGNVNEIVYVCYFLPDKKLMCETKINFHARGGSFWSTNTQGRNPVTYKYFDHYNCGVVYAVGSSPNYKSNSVGFRVLLDVFSQEKAK